MINIDRRTQQQQAEDNVDERYTAIEKDQRKRFP